MLWVTVVLCLCLTLDAAPPEQRTDPTACWSDGNGNSDGQYFAEGTKIVRGRYWYECVNGELAERGCVTKEGRELLIGDKFIDGGYQFVCIQDARGYLYLEPSACVDREGELHLPGDTWDSYTHPYWYRCKRQILFERTYLEVATVGCLVEKRRFDVGDVLEHKQGWWECQERWNGTSLCLKGCLYNGQRLKLNEKVDEGDGFTYQCTNRGGQPEVQCVGCLVRSERFSNGQRFFKDDSVFECDIMWNNHTKRQDKKHRLVGCLERDRQGNVIGEREVGCIWSKEENECKYEYRCGDQGKKENVGCTLSKDGHAFLYIPVGRFTIFNFGDDENKGAGCKLVNGVMEYVEIELDKLETETVGLAYYSPYTDKKR